MMGIHKDEHFVLLTLWKVHLNFAKPVVGTVPQAVRMTKRQVDQTGEK